ncbi:Bug family tripartite tricarboxylate transporter substrate binding protein [Enterobacter hormaechei]|uniref:Bug family tripartite tricarboxylate transporter substrate binding protein n=1 Tax=Enterobacter hormaechei TaxID=158836 RepID=UPI000750A60E|nr:tripartite tricarboxylate transporter substrate binding protein [Enterobacter hormaechei]KUR02963.1 ABC transporter substrate-binding protein [Enterobacter hormaechei subsp. xiangfangensis]
MKIPKFTSGLLTSLIAASSFLLASPTQAADYPTRQIELIVPFAAGGGTDLVARAFAEASKPHFPVGVGVINKPGGGGAIGFSELAASRPNGYKLAMGTAELTILPSLGMVKFKTEDFTPLGLFNMEPSAVTVKIDAPWNTLEEFLAWAKENPAQVRVGNSGTGAIWHLAAASLEDKTGVTFNHIPFDGATPAVTALLGGHIEAVTVSTAEVLNQVEDGKLKTLAVMSDQRDSNMPDVPTLQEKNIDLSIGAWRGLVISNKTPQNVIDFLTTAIADTANEPSFKEALSNMRLNYIWLDRAEFQALLEEQQRDFSATIEKLGLGQK